MLSKAIEVHSTIPLQCEVDWGNLVKNGRHLYFIFFRTETDRTLAESGYLTGEGTHGSAHLDMSSNNRKWEVDEFQMTSKKPSSENFGLSLSLKMEEKGSDPLNRRGFRTHKFSKMLEHKQFKINQMERDTTLIDVKFYDRKSKPLD